MTHIYMPHRVGLPGYSESVERDSYSGPDRLLVAEYLQSAEALVLATGWMPDAFDENILGVRPGTMTDGEWVWNLGLADYLGRYAIRLPDEFLSHVRANNHSVPSVSEERLCEVEQTLGM